MNFEDLNKRYKELAEKLQQATSGDPMLSVLITAMMTLYESLSGMFAEQKTTVQKLTAVIERLEARKKIETTFTGKDGKLYKYIRINNSAKKTDIELNLIRTQYSKLQAVAVDEDGQELADTRVEPTVYTATDFLKKSSMSINLMSLILEQMLNLKLPLNRISQYLSRYGVRYSRQ